MDLVGRMRFEEDGGAGVSEIDVLCVFDDRLVDARRAVFLREEDVARRRRPLEKQEVILFVLCRAMLVLFQREP